MALNAIYLGGVVVLPLLALCVLIVQHHGREVSYHVAWIARSSFIIVPVAIYGTFVEPFHLTVERVDVPIAQARLGADLRVAVLSDIQSAEVHEHLVEAVDQALAFEPHLILMPGDLIQVRYAETLTEAVPGFPRVAVPPAGAARRLVRVGQLRNRFTHSTGIGGDRESSFS